MSRSLLLLCCFVAWAVPGRGGFTERAVSQGIGIAPNPHAPATRKRDVQEPLVPALHASYDTSSIKTATLEIDSGAFFGFPYYFTNIALGTPNQAFRTVLDLNSGGVLVRAPDCGDVFGCGEGFEYNQSASSTYEDGKERFGIHLPAQYAYGNVSMDDMHLVSIKVENMTFGEVDEFYGENLWYDFLEEVADGAIGFGPPNGSMPLYTDTEVPNVLHHLLSSGALEKNVMTLILPYRPPERGSLKLGAAPIDPGTNTIRLPLAHANTYPFINTWHTALDKISLTGNTSLDLPLDNVFAGFELGQGFAFPRNVTESIWEAVGAEPDESHDLGYFNCTHWDSLPDMVLTFSGHDVVLEKEDYAFHGYFWPGGDTFCAVDVSPQWFSNDSVTLGSTFIRKFHMVFDMDEDELGCECFIFALLAEMIKLTVAVVYREV